MQFHQTLEKLKYSENMKKQFGGKATKELIEQYNKSPNWKKDKFENLETTSMEFSFQALPKLLYKQFFDKKGRTPESPIPIVPLDKEEFLTPSNHTKMIWYGHSVVLMRMNNKTILIDPMLGPDASPIAPFSTMRFSENSLDLIDDFPDIDLLLMTHDHYDHLDLKSIEKLKGKVNTYYVAIGVKRHLVEWGIPSEKITEFDWWDESIFEDIKITFTPTRHFSGRGLKDRAKSLWGGWVFKSQNENIWFSGDGGYGDHFIDIGEKLGPFDFAFMECGQYNENWHQIHMYPEESVQAALDGGAKCVMPVHWGGFALALHTWQDPADRFFNECGRENVKVVTPKIGEMFDYRNVKVKQWWKN